MTDEPDYVAAAKRVLADALNLECGDKVVIFSDETALTPAAAFVDGARALGLIVRVRKISIDEQRKYLTTESDSLSYDDTELLFGARAVLTCLTSDSQCSRFRQVLVEQSIAEDRVVGHMPGLTERILGEALNVDYRRASELCDDLALILCLGRTAELRTFAERGASEPATGVLTVDLGGIDRPSIVSSGVIPPGTWGNLPGGETFIAPIEGTASGTFLLTGSFDGHVLNPGDVVQLTFDRGRLIAFDGTDDAKTQFAVRLQEWHDSDPLNYSNFAELGIGINEQIRTLTGRALLDEKCSETIHIAIGANHGYGGTVKSGVHEDLVTWRPSLLVDGQSVIHGGKHSYSEDFWRENIQSVTPDQDLRANILLGRSASIRCEDARDGALKVRRAVSSGRLCQYTIGDMATSKILGQVYRCLPPSAFNMPLNEMVDHLRGEVKLEREQILRAITLLRKHGAITLNG